MVKLGLKEWFGIIAVCITPAIGFGSWAITLSTKQMVIQKAVEDIKHDLEFLSSNGTELDKIQTIDVAVNRQRIKALEDKFVKIDSKLDILIDQKRKANIP